jgi:hypothetical protein
MTALQISKAEVRFVQPTRHGNHFHPQSAATNHGRTSVAWNSAAIEGVFRMEYENEKQIKRRHGKGNFYCFCVLIFVVATVQRPQNANKEVAGASDFAVVHRSVPAAFCENPIVLELVLDIELALAVSRFLSLTTEK